MKVAMIRVRILLILSTLGILSASAQLQDAANRYRLAQSYEQGGDFESAVRLYNDLYLGDPANYSYFDGLRRALLQLKRYDEAIALLHQRTASNPTDVTLFCLLADAQYKGGKEKEAYDSWEKAVNLDPVNANVYRLVANSQLDNRLFEKTAELYRRARKQCGDPNLFTLELAQLLSVTMDYAGATSEFLRYLQHAPTQLGYVQTRLAQFTGKPEGRRAAIEVVRAAQRSSDDINLYRLLGWLMLEGREFADAFDVYKQLDKLAHAQGNEIYGFAERAYKEGAYAVAAEAYNEALRVPLSPQRLPYAKFGYALAMKELSVQSDTIGGAVPGEAPVPESQSRYAAAIENFRRVIAEYPHSEFAARSYYQIGMLQFERYFDLDGALASFQEVEKLLPPGSNARYDVAIAAGKVLIAKGDSVGAISRFRTVIAAPNATPDQQDEATFHLAELEYYGGRFTEAITALESISGNPKANFTNDALQRLAFLQENTASAELPLREFARADFLSQQKKYTEAISILDDIITKNPQALFVDDGLMRIASLQRRAGRFADALATYQRLLHQFKEISIALDKAQFGIAEVYDYNLHDKSQALNAYEKLLAQYPQSLLVEQARKRIRELRGDSS
jgi:tetratricopeptide (TPR) repeat protein